MDLHTWMLYSSTLSMLTAFNNETEYTIGILGYVEYDLDPYCSKPPNFMQLVD